MGSIRSQSRPFKFDDLRSFKFDDLKRDLAALKKSELSDKPLDLSTYLPSRRFRVQLERKTREEKREHYEPQLLSLGLYGRPNPKPSEFEESNQFEEGDKFRIKIVSAFLSKLGKTSNKDWDEICERVVPKLESVERHRLYYPQGLGDTPLNIIETLEARHIQQVLTRDAIFSACYFFKRFCSYPLHDVEKTTATPSFRAFLDYICGQKPKSFHDLILIDMWKLENQIPLSLMKTVYEMLTESIVGETIGGQNAKEVAKLMFKNVCEETAMEFVCRYMPGFDMDSKGQRLFAKILDSESEENGLLTKCAHMLHCAATLFWKQSATEEGILKKKDQQKQSKHMAIDVDQERNQKQANVDEEQEKNKILKKKEVDAKKEENDPQKQENDAQKEKEEEKPFPTAEKLEKAGIKCRGQIGKGLIPKLINKRTVFLPTIPFIGDDHETIWRNLLALEVGCEEEETGHLFQSYLRLMNQLVDTKQDIITLRKRYPSATGKSRPPVIATNGLGDNDEIVKLFNTITKGTAISDPSKAWLTSRKEVYNCHYSWCRRQRFQLKTHYFGEAWVIISVIAALALFALSIIQTVYSILSYQKA